uniref:Uncharacterized protein n=1 Tax=Aegilops tauschii subsp. strangulata TaxID=200361 RepID=A0A453NRK3_AEGTS
GSHVGWCSVAVPLAEDGGRAAASDGVHEPVGVVVVDDVEEAVAAARHPLHQASPEVVEGDGDLHHLVLRLVVAGAEEHHVVVVGQVGVGDGDGRGHGHHVDHAVLAIIHGEVVHPHFGGVEDGDAVAVGAGADGGVGCRHRHVAAVRVYDAVHVEVVDDDVVLVLDGEPTAVGHVHLRPAPVDGLVALDDDLLGRVDHHVPGEDDPQRLRLDRAPPERPGPRVGEVIVVGVGHDVDLALEAAGGLAAEPLGAAGHPLPVRRPVLAAAPAPVDRVRRHARARVLCLLRLLLRRQRTTRASRPACTHAHYMFMPMPLNSSTTHSLRNYSTPYMIIILMHACLWTARLKWSTTL